MFVLASCSGPAPDKKVESGAPAPPKITQFYADRAEVGPGEHAILCYGVESTKEVRLTPEVEKVGPSLNRCIEVRPEANTEYTLTAVGEDGRESTATLTIRRGHRATRMAPSAGSPSLAPVDPAGDLQVLDFSSKSPKVAPGASATLCYAVQGASSVRVQPGEVQLGGVQRGCFYVTPDRTTTYTLTAEGGGKTATKQLTVNVQ